MSAELAAFLAARFDEDEAVAGALPGDGWAEHDGRVLRLINPGRHRNDPGLYWPDRWNPVRVLADIESKRRIVEHCAGRLRDWAEGWHDSGDRETAMHDLLAVLKGLALPYARHPDYQPEWTL